ncbi:hypothetical protein CHS0354_010503, partial [Potamilus streckersoni]
MPVVSLATTDSCGDPVKESMCKLAHDEVCLCYDVVIASVVCPNYCADRCGPVNRNVICPGPLDANLDNIGFYSTSSPSYVGLLIINFKTNYSKSTKMKKILTRSLVTWGHQH